MFKIFVLFCLAFSTFTAHAKMKEIPKVSIKKAIKSTLERTLFFPVSILSKTNSQIKSDGEYIVVKRIAKLGQKIKKNAPLLILKNQDTSTHYEKRIIRSPIAGVVAGISVENGQYISRGSSLIHINNPDQLYGKIEIPAADYKKVKTGLVGKLSITSMGLKKIPVKISGVGAAADRVTGTISVELEITKDMDKLLPGVIGLAEITLNKEEILLVKEKALYYIGEDVFIPTIDKSGDQNKVKKIKVKLGRRVKDRMEILSGLELEREYISEAAKFLRNGEKVSIKKTKKK
jgi:multidrug efflux pump subunit AcrA (membrane-fusion protein)